MTTISTDYIPISNNSKWNYLKVQVYYSLGGMNYFSGNVEDRGVYLSITPVHRTEGEYTSEVVTAYTGTKFLLEKRSRWSKTLLNYELDQQHLEACISHVCSNNNISKDNLNYAIL